MKRLLLISSALIVSLASAFPANAQTTYPPRIAGFVNVISQKAVAIFDELGKKDANTAPKPLRAIYLTAYTASDNWGRDMIKTLKENGGNAVVVDIQHGGGLLAFRPKNDLLQKINPGSDLLEGYSEIIDELHKEGIYVIARQVAFNNPYISQRKPGWRIKNKWNGLFDARWLDPSMAGVQIMNLLIMREVAEMGFDEIQFDYIRFPATNHNNLDYHYDESRFERADIIVDFLNKARTVADYYGIQLSVDVFGAIVWGDVDWRIVGQDPARIAEVVDAIYPMTYPSHVSPGYYGHNNPYGDPYSFVFNSIEKFTQAANGKAEIRTWIQGFPLRIPGFGTWFIRDQIKASFDAGADGFSIWSPGNIYTLSWPTLSLNPPALNPETGYTDEGHS